jgi:hypothetical protein
MESTETINQRLKDYFGVAWNNDVIWRVVWSEDQFEKRLTAYTDTGLQLLFPEVRELPKYKQWIKEKYVLERLTVIPEINKDELTEKISYEPIFVFEDKNGFALPPRWEACKFVIDSILAAQGEESMFPKYVESDLDQPQEVRNARIEKLQEELFGNETNTTDALTYKQAIVVPNNFVKEN